MSLEIYETQKRISLVIIGIGILTIIFNIYGAIKHHWTILEIISYPSFYLTPLFVVIFFLTIKINSNIIRILHICIFFVCASIPIIQNYESFYGLGFYILSIILMIRYGYFQKKIIFKISTIVLFLIVLVEISSYQKNKVFLIYSMNVIIFLLFFILILYILYRDEFNSIVQKSKKMENSMNDMIIEKNRSLSEASKLNKKIKKLEKLISSEDSRNVTSEEYKLSLKEQEVIELLCKFRASNQEIADKMFISSGTVKQHFYRIYRKCGVRKRVDIIFLFQNNFR